MDSKTKDLIGKRFDLCRSERRILEIQLRPVVELRKKAKELEQAALDEVAGCVVERLSLPEGIALRFQRNKDGSCFAEVVGLPEAPASSPESVPEAPKGEPAAEKLGDQVLKAVNPGLAKRLIEDRKKRRKG